ncbi:ABC-three component system protein [Demequina zhanjiangensis]|uniref:ABC-three component systems C-terminal domain-containing protein n=1 Tax=Demequina zhanjiangensis TaxID=3051659 RepID=A0ABT8G177_9MICO|nr:ABC-three component system protein [Demequina sp. SYSU T00b26]MDN4472881.1 hypothetical protein [Demequina sp. SYSU T00b26]
MRYPFHDLDDSKFERLVVALMRELFGLAVEEFSPGPDGGRDARFTGTAERFPSAASPWVGCTIGQAKHTSGFNTHISDSDFSGAGETSLISVEIERVKALVKSGELDNYLLITNRRAGAIAATDIRDRIAREVGIPTERIFVAGIEFLDSMLEKFPGLVRQAHLEMPDVPLNVPSQDLAEIILAVSKALGADDLLTDAPVVDRVSLAQKDAANGMSSEFSSQLARNYLDLTIEIQRFLAAPGNVDVLRRYEAAVEDFQLKIIAHRSDFESFDRLFNYLVGLLFSRDTVLGRERRLTRALVFYMYWNCDIGRVPDAIAE